MTNYILTQEDKDIALELSESATSFAILEHLNGWQTLPKNHSQSNIKDKEIAIAKLAYKLSLGGSGE